MIACLLGANSGAGFVLAGGLSLFALSMYGLCLASPSLQIPTFGVTLLGVLTAYLIGDTISAYLTGDTLSQTAFSILGKESTLTGRTTIWYDIDKIMQGTSYAILGRGYFAGFLQLGEVLSNSTNMNVINAHNGYLEIFIGLGLTGLILCVSILMWIAWMSFDFLFRQPIEMANTFPLTAIAFTAGHAVVESTLMQPNNLSTLVLSVVAGALLSARFWIKRFASAIDQRESCRQRLLMI